jgi:heme/copper-type cytochrome/quinol oxidase subunit 2
MIKIFKLTLLLTLATGCLALMPAKSQAADFSAKDVIQCGVNTAAGADAANGKTDCSNRPDSGQTLTNLIKDIINILSAVVGVVAVIMLIVAGFRYVSSAGNDSAVGSAKNTIVYAVVGLVIVALAQVIVHFVLNNIISNSSSAAPSDSGNSAPAKSPVKQSNPLGGAGGV